jgi:two-component system sensor histidine kinase BaeS
VKTRLLWKLLGIHLAIIATVILVIWLAIDYRAADYFMVLMDRFHISPGEMNQLFLNAVHRYLIWATLLALTLAVALSFLLTRKVLRPLSQMAEVTRRVAAGDYSARVPVASSDEVGSLAADFNRMADSLARVEQLRKTMVADAAHELRTPLTNVRGYLEALRDGVLPPSSDTFEMLHSEVLRLVRLSESLLELARADAARADLRLEEVSLRSLVEEAIALGEPKFRRKGLVVEQSLDEGVSRVTADPEKLRQVLRNLLENAWQYSSRGGRVSVTAQRADDSVRLTFANPGEGLSAEDIPFIFERFYRADKSRSREHGGAGIGLSIVKELIEAHGGHVGAASSDGETRIWVSLPLQGSAFVSRT